MYCRRNMNDAIAEFEELSLSDTSSIDLKQFRNTNNLKKLSPNKKFECYVSVSPLKRVDIDEEYAKLMDLCNELEEENEEIAMNQEDKPIHLPLSPPRLMDYEVTVRTPFDQKNGRKASRSPTTERRKSFPLRKAKSSIDKTNRKLFDFKAMRDNTQQGENHVVQLNFN